MAIIDKKGRLHGKLGKFNYRVLPGNKEVVQTLPRNVKQTRATKESALEFGLASNSAGILRQAFSALTYLSDPGIINRLNGAVLRAIKGCTTKSRGERDLHDGDASQLKGFQFNVNSPLDQVLPVRPVCVLDAENRIRVSIPAFNWRELKKTAYSHSSLIRVMLTVVNFTEGFYNCLDYTDFKVENSGLNSFEWMPESQIPAGCIALVTLSIHGYSYDRNTEERVLMNSVAYHPAEIIGAFSISAESTSMVTKKLDKTRKISDYKGPDILKRIESLRKKDKKYVLDGSEQIKPVDAPALLKKKVFFKKE